MLTNRELEVIELIIQDVKRKEIALTLHISEETVKKHTRNIFNKFEVNNRQELSEKLNNL